MPQRMVFPCALSKEIGRILREVASGLSVVFTVNGQAIARRERIVRRELAGIRHEPRTPGARFSDIAAEPGRADESALESLLILRGKPRHHDDIPG